jgi:D-alanine-D-alanine ligase
MTRRRRKRVLVLLHEDLVPPDSIDDMTDAQIAPFKTEFDVVATLKEMGHNVLPLGVSDDLGVMRRAIERFKPAICFNLLEEFHGLGVYDAHVVSYLELMRQPYTGCNPRGLMLAHNKAMSKMICRYHRIPVPGFAVFQIGRKVRRPAKLEFPLLVKSLTEEGSVGISQASVVYDDQKLADRVAFVHRAVGTDAIAEQYIDGRELYVGVLGNDRLQVLPIWEMVFSKLREDAPKIATGKIKWNMRYQAKIGLSTQLAKDLDEPTRNRIRHLCKRIYKALGLSGYARMDLRLTEDGRAYLIEANPNPNLSYGEDFAESAEKAGLGYDQLLHRLITLGLNYRLRGQA